VEISHELARVELLVHNRLLDRYEMFSLTLHRNLSSVRKDGIITDTLQYGKNDERE